MSNRESIIQQLSSFELGKYLLANRVLNGYWTHYCVAEHPKDRSRKIHSLEAFLLNEAPTFLATQERFTIFQSQLQQRLRNEMAAASIPCGYMDDLLSLDYENAPQATLTGCDIDPSACQAVSENARNYSVHPQVQTHCMDAWTTGEHFPETFDIISSNGLNIYVADAEKEIDLYRNFAGALKQGGYLITSFLTPPPQLNPASPWQNVDPAAIEKQKVIFGDVLGVKWQNYNMPDEMKDKLAEAGFHNFEIHYDRQRIFPTIAAQKM